MLQAIALGGGRNVFAATYIAAHRLGSHSSMQTSLRLLLKEQVLVKVQDEYRFTDPFLREWLSTRQS